MNTREKILKKTEEFILENGIEKLDHFKNC